jgi:hypothetical protein
MQRILVTLALAATLVVLAAVSAAAHPHEVTTGKGNVVVLANGQNHPGFVADPDSGLFLSCEGIADLPNMGPAGYARRLGQGDNTYSRGWRSRNDLPRSRSASDVRQPS